MKNVIETVKDGWRLKFGDRNGGRTGWGARKHRIRGGMKVTWPLNDRNHGYLISRLLRQLLAQCYRLDGGSFLRYQMLTTGRYKIRLSRNCPNRTTQFLHVAGLLRWFASVQQ